MTTTSNNHAGTVALREAAELLASLPDNVPTPSVTFYGHTERVDVNWYLELQHVSEDQRRDLARVVRAIGGTWDKEPYGADFTMRQRRGHLNLLVQATRDEVCTRRVVGTREITRTVPAQPAMPATSEHTVTEVVEDVEWDCEPILPATRESVTA